MAQQDDNIADALRYLTAALEVSMYGTPPDESLKNLLRKLNIKSARNFGSSLKMQSLSVVLKQTSFDVNKLQLWKNIK